jgi:DNA-binding NtrC family response regulator
MTAVRPARILVVDDDVLVCDALRTSLWDDGYDVTVAHSPAQALRQVASRGFDVVIIDMNFSKDTTGGSEGEALLVALRDLDASLPVIALTAWGAIDAAVRCVRAGARDYLVKPWQPDELRSLVEACVAEGRMRGSIDSAAQGTVHGTGAAMRRALDIVERTARTDVLILLTGEAGTGKTLFARHIHARSDRASAPFVTADLASLPDGLFERELFGHVRGAFTDANADRPGRCDAARGGTLLLDEIGTIGARQQAALLRLLQSGEYEPLGGTTTRRLQARVIAATNADLAAAVSAGQFREDLYPRLEVVRIHIPPLRERREDILPLAATILRDLAARHGRPVASLSYEAMAALSAHAWPGNLREMAHTLERAVLLSASTELGPQDLFSPGAPRAPGGTVTTLDAVTRDAIVGALRHASGNMSRAARALGISRQALYRRIENLGLDGQLR